MTEEIWKDVPGFEGRYQVSDAGRVRSLDRYVNTTHHGWVGQRLMRGRVLKLHAHEGYLSAPLGKGVSQRVSILVLTTFVGPPPTSTHQAAHGDGIRSNNVLTNLRWATPKENADDKEKHGRTVRGTAHHMAKLTPELVLAIRQDARPQRLVASIYGISQLHVSRIKRRLSWATL